MNVSRWSWKRRLSAVLGVVLLAGCVVAVVLLTTGSTTEPSAAETAAIRRQIELWLTRYDISWPEQAFASKGLPQSYVDHIAARDESILAKVATDEFAAQEFETPGTYVIQAMYDSSEKVTFDCEHELMSFEYAGASGVDAQNYRVRVWYGESRGSWDPAQKKLVDTSKVDGVILYQVTMVPVGGTWKIADAKRRESVVDGDSEQYGPDTPHEPF